MNKDLIKQESEKKSGEIVKGMQPLLKRTQGLSW